MYLPATYPLQGHGGAAAILRQHRAHARHTSGMGCLFIAEHILEDNPKRPRSLVALSLDYGNKPPECRAPKSQGLLLPPGRPPGVEAKSYHVEGARGQSILCVGGGDTGGAHPRHGSPGGREGLALYETDAVANRARGSSAHRLSVAQPAGFP